MADEQVKEWIQKKLDRGVSSERLKKTLEKTDRDPSLVDEVIGGETSDTGSTEETPDLDDEDFEEHSSSQGESDGLDSLKFVDNDDSSEDTEQVPESTEESDEGGSFSLPSMPSLPSVSLPAMSSSSKVLPLLLILLVAGLGYAGMNMMEGSVSSAVSDSLDTCTDGVGVKMYAVGENNGKTVADVYTGKEAETTLEIYSGDQKMGETTKVINGRGVIRVNAVGDRAVFHETGCDEPKIQRNY